VGPEELAGHAKLKRALEWSRVVCAGFWKITWDSSLGSGTEVVVGPDGKVVRNDDQSPMDPSLLEMLPPRPGARSLKKQKVNRGDVRIDVRSPFEVFPDPLAEGMDECERFWEEVILSPRPFRAASALSSSRTPTTRRAWWRRA
jgi:hypothetical protein